MRTARLLVVLALVFFAMGGSPDRRIAMGDARALPWPEPVVTVADNYGGNIDQFMAEIAEYRALGVRVRIEGMCASSCTMLASLPRVCVKRGAKLGFHQAFYAGWPPKSTDVFNRSESGVADLMAHYPPRLRAWIARHGGLGPHLIVLSGSDMLRIFKACPA